MVGNPPAVFSAGKERHANLSWMNCFIFLISRHRIQKSPWLRIRPKILDNRPKTGYMFYQPIRCVRLHHRFGKPQKIYRFLGLHFFEFQLPSDRKSFFSWNNKKGAADPKTGYAFQIFHAKLLAQIDEKNPWRPLKKISGCQGENMVY
jgi:hypothetical protein